MVKNVVFILSLFVLAACSGKGTDVELKVSKSFAVSAQNGGGAVLYINNPDTKDSKTIVVEKEEVTVTLLNGNWDFSVVSWSGSTPLSGDLTCAKKSAVLSGQKVEIDLDPTVGECETSAFSKNEISFVNCHTLSGITPGETCDGLARGQAESYQIRFETEGNKGLSSSCIGAQAAPGSTVHTSLALPFTYISDFKFDLFSDANCSSGKKTFSHYEAFNDQGVLYFAYGGVSSTPPVATNVTPPDGVSGIESVITLSYIDYNLDLATSCVVSNLSNLVVTTPCSCTLGTCTVGVSEPYGYVGMVGFDYIVVANGEPSNSASVSFNLLEPPEPDWAPEVQTLAFAGNFPLSTSSLELPYTDPNYDYATSCEIVSYTGFITPEICTCSSGVCSIPIYTSAYGPASIEYKVTANGLESNTGTISFNILEAPFIEYAPYLTSLFNQNVNFAPMSASDNGETFTCTISPALPTGLAFNPYSCNISGTADTVLNSTTFTVTATNSAGSTETNFTFEVQPLTPTVDYTTALISDFYTQEFITITPNVVENGSPITSCTIAPPLPIGLSFNSNTCEISGTPAVALDQSFTVTANNAAGLTDVTIQLKIQSPFVTKWQVVGGELITLPLTDDASYNFKVDWGDGTDPAIITSWDSPEKSHLYASAGIYEVKIYGQFPRIKFQGSGEGYKLYSIEQWGTTKWTSMEGAFDGCSSLQINALDAPDLSQAQSLKGMFQAVQNPNTNFNSWDTTTITDMSYMFSSATNFNSPLSFDTSSVTNMSYMFASATSFNQPLNWMNTSNVTTFEGMFQYTPFNQDISLWNTMSAINMKYMFMYASAFNQPLSSWNTSNVVYFDSMFSNATSFGQNLNTWDVSSALSYDYFDNNSSMSGGFLPSFTPP